jgi:phosphatidylglycerophosphatase A
MALAAAVVSLLGVWAAARAAAAYRREDPAQVVIDEVAGMWLTLAGAAQVNAPSLAAGFVLFRLFDIWKPFPLRRLERLPGGWGVMADDLGAGLYAALVLSLSGCLNLY